MFSNLYTSLLTSYTASREIATDNDYENKCYNSFLYSFFFSKHCIPLVVNGLEPYFV